MNEFNPNCGKCGMLNSRGFCSLTACRYPSNVIVVEPNVIRGMMVNPQIKKPMTNGDNLHLMPIDDLAALCSSPCPPDQQCGRNVVAPLPECVECWKKWLEEET